MKSQSNELVKVEEFINKIKSLNFVQEQMIYIKKTMENLFLGRIPDVVEEVINKMEG
jgi:hypothetical protein